MEDVKPPLTVPEAEQRVKENAKAPKVTKEYIQSRIADVKYLYDGTFTICVITMKNGYKSIGHSAPVSEANYDKQVGDTYAYERAFIPLWQLEAYLMLEAKLNAPG